MNELPEAIGAAAARHHAERVEWTVTHPPIEGRPAERGDLIVASNEHGSGIVLVVRVHDTHLNVLWTHSSPDMAFDADIILPARTVALWPVVISTELYGQVYQSHVQRIIAHLDLGEPVSWQPGDGTAFVQVAATYADRLGGTVGTRWGGPGDGRRWFLDEQLDDVNRLSASVRRDLIGWAP